MQARVKDYAGVLNVGFFLNLLPPNVFTSFWPLFSIFWHIKARSDMFRHNHIYSGIIYLGIFKHIRTLRNPTSIFNTLVYPEPEAYSEPWYVQVSELPRGEAYSEPWNIQGSE